MKCYLTILCLIFVFPVFAQDIKVDLSKAMRRPLRWSADNIIGKSSEAFYAVRMSYLTGYARITIERYDETYNKTVSQTLDLNAGGEILVYEATVLFNEKVYVFGSYFDKINDIEKLYAFEMDPVSLEVSSNPELVAKIESKHNSNFLFDLSENQEYLSITGIPGDAGDNIYAYTVNVYAVSKERLWAFKEINSYEKSTFFVRETLVDNKGNVYIMAQQYDEKVRDISSFLSPSYKFLLIAITDGGKTQNIFPLKLKSRKYIAELNFRVMDNGTVVCGGFYSDSYSGGYSGVCFFSLDPQTGNIEVEGLKAFDAKELSEFMSGKNAEKGKDIHGFELRDIVLREDGGLIMIAEYYSTATGRENSNGFSNVTDAYIYNSLLVSSVNPDLSIDWLQKIPKKQVTFNDDGIYSSYALMVQDEYLYILFNDKLKNLDILENDDKLLNFNGKRSVVASVRIARDGSMQKSLLFDKKKGLILYPYICEQVSYDKMIIYGKVGRGYVVGKLTF